MAAAWRNRTERQATAGALSAPVRSRADRYELGAVPVVPSRAFLGRAPGRARRALAVLITRS